MKDPHKLAKLLTDNIMVFHDSANYIGLEKNSIKLAQEMGLQKKTSTKIGKDIKEIYKLYDKAQENYEKKQFLIETELYNRAKNYADDINKIIQNGNDVKILVDVVVNWRHKNKLGALYQIFKYWARNLSLIDAIICTVSHIKAGTCHDKRKYDGFKKNFIRIYKILIKNKKIQILF